MFTEKVGISCQSLIIDLRQKDKAHEKSSTFAIFINQYKVTFDRS